MEVLSFRDADISCQQWGHSELKKCHFSFKEVEGKKESSWPKRYLHIFAARTEEFKWQELFNFWWVLMRPSAYSHFPQDAEIVIPAVVWKTMSKLLWIFLIIFSHFLWTTCALKLLQHFTLLLVSVSLSG